MKNILILILAFSLFNCNYDKNTSELNKETEKINPHFVGIFEYKTSEQSENHYIVIDTLNGKYNGIYFGSEDSGGHGVFFYGNEMENLNLINGKISFEISKRDLYETTRLRIVKHRDDLENDSIRGISKGQLKYNGEISKSGIKINCESEFGDCWNEEFVFEKLKE